MLAGILVGALIMALVRLDQVEPALTATVESETAQAPENRPRFDFYTLLKETEIIVPDPPVAQSEEEQETPAAPPSSEPRAETRARSSTSTDVFLLQAGSFKSARDADSLRARLLLLNMSASVQKVSPRPGETWHRVLVGPFNSRSGVSEARATLARNGIDNILLKRRQ